jgi:hypothetical protein
VYQWCGFKSRGGKNKNLSALKSNSNTVWFNFQTYIYISIYRKCDSLKWIGVCEPIKRMTGVLCEPIKRLIGVLTLKTSQPFYRFAYTNQPFISSDFPYIVYVSSILKDLRRRTTAIIISHQNHPRSLIYEKERKWGKCQGDNIPSPN